MKSNAKPTEARRPDFLLGPVALSGLSTRLAAALARLAPRMIDLCLLVPRGIADRSYRPSLEALAERIDGQGPTSATLTVEIVRARPARYKGPHIIVAKDDVGEIDLVFFHGNATQLTRRFPIGERLVVSGRCDLYRDRLRMAHPDRVVLAVSEAEHPAELEPIYPLTAGVSQNVLMQLIRRALALLPDIPEWIVPDPHAGGLPSFTDAIRNMHLDADTIHRRHESASWRRLAYDELLAMQIAQCVMRARIATHPAPLIAPPGRLRSKALAGLGFALTGGQLRCLQEIATDMGHNRPMTRLVQGDVGCGKTLVALLAMLDTVEAGYQAAMLAPTGLLAHQHYATLQPIADRIGVRIALLTGRMSAPIRRRVLAGLRSGAIQMVVGTHAIIQKSVVFQRLGLAVIDEQHRFGVMQRLAILDKSDHVPADTGDTSELHLLPETQAEPSNLSVHLLSMSATPIPRSLLLTVYGDIDVSVIEEKPVGRPVVTTRLVSESRTDEVIAGLARAIEGKQKIYWVCPQILQDEATDFAAAEDRYAVLSARFPDRVGLVHGRIAEPERDRIITDFADPTGIDVLVATTVIEVGIDVPAASVMVIENAERFGLAQLHQLRGRIGRGVRESSCILLYGEDVTAVGRERLRMLRDCHDGFRIAEADLELRGGGDASGTRQSGLPQLALANLALHRDLADQARRQARYVTDRDPVLSSSGSERYRFLLHIFNRAEVLTRSRD